jgi:transglutaminase-like putative cysteine protease
MARSPSENPRSFPGGAAVAALAALGVLAGFGTAVAGEKPFTAASLLRTTGAPRTVKIAFVHTARNLSLLPLEDVTVAVAVPRSDERQTIHLIRFEPPPERVTADGWDQETAHFPLGAIAAGGEASVRWEAIVTLREAAWRVADRDIGDPSEVPERVIRHYLRGGENYRIDGEAVRAAAARLSLAGHGALERVRRIHDFVMDSLEYDRDDRWDSAGSVLRTGKGSCSEYAYLMIALCRLHGIPARYAGGSALVQTGAAGASAGARDVAVLQTVDRVFHRWVEVYLPRVGWYPVDPARDDDASAEGDPYRFFGRVPWFHFTMFRGDGDPLESGRLGWEYRSTMRWKAQRSTPPGAVVIDRSATWSSPAPKDQALSVAAQR